MYSKRFIEVARVMSISALCLLAVQAQAQSMGMDVAVLGKILTELKEMRNDEIKAIKNSEEAIKNSETAPRGTPQEGFVAIEHKPIGEVESMKKLIEEANKNLTGMDEDINKQLDRIKNLHNVMIDKKNIDGLLKVQQLQLQMQSITASINTTNNQIQLDKFKTENVAREIQRNLKEKNREIYTKGDHQRAPVNFKGQFFLGRHNNQP